MLNVEAEEHDVSVLHDVFLAFRAYLSFFLCGGDGAELDQRRPIHYVRADKSLFEIRVDDIKYDDFIRYGSEAAVREAGKLNVEGKEYVVEDGDIMHFRFNV